MGDGEGRESKLCLWNHPGTDVTGMVARCEKVAGTCAEVPMATAKSVLHCHIQSLFDLSTDCL